MSLLKILSICDFETISLLAIAMAELPNLLSPPEVAEALLRLKYGPEIICHMVANQPDSFAEGKISVGFHFRGISNYIYYMIIQIVQAYCYL